MIRKNIPEPPTGLTKLRWYGPGLLWMLSAVGTGSILFTPRVAAAYEYTLAWLLLLVVFFMWVMIREMARFTIVTGNTMMEGFFRIPGPKGWAVWFIFVPQLCAASVGIAGLSAVVGSALQAFLPGSGAWYAVLLVVICTLTVASGKYSMLERISRIMALVLMVAAIVAAFVVSPKLSNIGSGLMFGWPSDPDLYVILPWVGTILAGSMGIVWFGYWIATRGFGGGFESANGGNSQHDASEQVSGGQQLSEEATHKLVKWLRIMTTTATVGVVGGLIVIFSFLILGAELLAPENMMPKGSDVAVDLTKLFSEIWGSTGEYLLLSAMIIALGGSVLANQDGWGRSFADMTLILLGASKAKKRNKVTSLLVKLEQRLKMEVSHRVFLKRLFIATITGVIPIAIILIFEDPVVVMSASGIIAALHTPFIAFMALYVNRTQLPKPLAPSWPITVCMAASGLFYFGFAVVYLWSLANK